MTQMAQVMGISMVDLQLMLVRCGIQPKEHSLDPKQVQTLIGFLKAHQRIEEAHAKSEQKRAEKNLEAAVMRYAILIDTCSLLHAQFPQLLTNLEPLLRKHSKTLIIPSGVIAELDALFLKKPALRQQISQLRPQLADLAKQGLVKVYGDPVETFGDKQFLEASIRYKLANEILVITQDRNLAADLFTLRQTRSVHGKKLIVRRINRFGFLSAFKNYDHTSISGLDWQGWGDDAVETVPLRVDHTPIPTDEIPTAGSAVYDAHGNCRTLGELISSGGEGNIYALDETSVAKIYHAGKLTRGQKEKLETMVSMDIRCAGVCWPRELLYNRQEQLIGYRMERATGRELQHCVFNRVVLMRSFPDWGKKDTVQLCVTILEKFCALHNRGILVGDINPHNIMVVSPEEVWFVDCDSYQFGGFPCPVGTVRFTAPEIQKKHFAEFLRSRGSENFGVATLLFMIMLPGKAPYAQRGAEDMGEAIGEMNFPYPFGENRSENTPEGDWRYLWSHLPYFLKEAFFETFQKGGRYSREHTRLSAEQWLRHFRYYLDLLENGGLKDPESGLLFPTRCKCVNPHDAEVYRHMICVACGEPYDITQGEWNYLMAHNLPVPSLCPTCRKLKRLKKAGYSVDEI